MIAQSDEVRAPARRRSRSRTFDAVAGLFLPILLLLIDPAVFRGSDLTGSALLGKYRCGCYIVTAIFVAVLAAWIVLRRWPAFCAGTLWIGALFALCLGLWLVPFSFIGTFFGGVGLLGFAPFLMTYVYWRNAMEASSLADHRTCAVPLALLGAALPVLLAGVGHIGVARAFARGIERSVSEDAREQAAGIALLDFISPLRDIDELLWVYDQEGDPIRQGRIATAYERVSGKSFDAEFNIWSR